MNRGAKNVLLIGSGGREHALAWKLAQSPRLGKLFIAPGNGGTARLGENVPIKADDIPALVAFAKKSAIDLVVVGPEDPMALGREDEEHGEERYVTMGMDCFGRILVVVYTWREENIRIISARRANKSEARQYESKL